MILSPTVKCVTSNLNNLKKSLEIFKFRIISCNFATNNSPCGKKKKKKKNWWFWKRKKTDDLKKGNDSMQPILEPRCKIGMIIGGSKGFGFVAASELLSKGARKVVIADKNEDRGDRAVQRLCDTYGKDRATFIKCDTRDSVLLEATFSEVICRYRSIHVLFNNLDENQSLLSGSLCSKSKDNWSNTRRISMIGLKFMGTENGGSGGIIVNCASILGFMDWPQNPSPVYCKSEPIIEVTRHIADEHPVEENGVRFVALCPTNKPFEKIALPDFPPEKKNNECAEECVPPKKVPVGLALNHVITRANSGSTWIVPPFPRLYELPKLIHFPNNPDELVDPEIYKKENCPVVPESYCAKILEETKPVDINASCGLTGTESKRKRFFSRRKK